MYNDNPLDTGLLPVFENHINSLEKYTEFGEKYKIFKGESITHSIPKGYYMCYILNGSFKAFIEDENGYCTYIAVLKEGCILKSSSSDNRHNLKQLALENSEILAFPIEKFNELIKNNQELLYEYSISRQKILECYTNRLTHLSNPFAMGKVLSYINNFLADAKIVDKRYIINFPFSQKDLAEYLFLNEKTCNKIFKYLRENNVLEKTNKEIIIYDLDKFNELMNEKNMFQ